MLTTTTGPWSFTASGSSGSFNITAPVYDTDALGIYAVNVATGAIYGVTGVVTLADDRSGAVVAVASGLTAGHKVTVYRVPKLTQAEPFNPSGPFPNGTAGRQLDRAFADIQALNQMIRRGVRAPLTDDVALADLPIAALRINKVAGYGSDSQPIAFSDTTALADIPSAVLRAGKVFGWDGAGLATAISNVPVSPQITLGTFWQTALLTSTAAAARATVALPGLPTGRLSLTSGSPVINVNVTGGTQIYWVPYGGGVMPLWSVADGEFRMRQVGQLTNDITASAVGKAGPAAVIPNKNYDVFSWDDNGTARLTRGPAWANDISRGTGAGTSELQVHAAGYETNKNAITNGPAAGVGLYLGTFRPNGSGVMDWAFGTLNATAFFSIWNRFNRVGTSGGLVSGSSSWSYNANTFRPIEGSVGWRLYLVSGLFEEFVQAKYVAQASHSGGSLVTVGIGIDSTTDNNAQIGTTATALSGDSVVALPSAEIRYLPFGFHVLQALEKGFGSAGTMTWYGPGSGLLYDWRY